MSLKKIFFALPFLSIMACQKATDQETPAIELTRKYCNDPYAVNYNDSFPGIPDNTKCRYPFDVFLGTWEMQDSVFRSDNSYLSANTRDITFTEVSDTLRNKMNVNGWCSGSPLKLSANKYGKAMIVNQLPYPDSAQVACGNDTLMGYMQISILSNDTMHIEMVNRNTSGNTVRHKALATRKD